MDLNEIKIRDPFVYRDDARRCYFLFGTSDPDPGVMDSGIGFDCYRSEDLQLWEGPIPAFRPPTNFWATHHFWAPEVHRYDGWYYMLATFKANNRHRGTQVLRSASPEGPYLPISDRPVTPQGWECLDGTLHVDDHGEPWLVFCQEWTQVHDGGMWAMRLSRDLTRANARPVFLFNASEAPWKCRQDWPADGSEFRMPTYVTDGPWLFTGFGGLLMMLWSSMGKQGYAMGLAQSESGKVTGPWKQLAHPLPVTDGGHGMIFETFGREKVLTFHSPNIHPKERAVFRNWDEIERKMRATEEGGSGAYEHKVESTFHLKSQESGIMSGNFKQSIVGMPEAICNRVTASPLTSYFLPVARIVWQSDAGVENADTLLERKSGQSVLGEYRACILKADESTSAGILLDFGTELHGNIEIFTPVTESVGSRVVRIRLGESVSEAMSELGEKYAQSDHAIRDQEVQLPWLGKATFGPSGFRFARIDSVAGGQPVEITQVRAVLTLRDIPAIGSFRSNDERINQIWAVGSYTVHLNMQEYLWDGIKRDRLVWVGDMHPEVSTINAVFGFNPVVSESLDLARDTYAPTSWMNGFSSYSLWWILMQRDMWLHHGHREYLEEQRSYLKELIKGIITHIANDGSEQLTGVRFLDWPTAENEVAIHEGLQALVVLTMEAGGQLCDALNEPSLAKECREAAAKLRKHVPGPGVSKQSAALMLLAGLIDETHALAILEKEGPRNLSTFYGYYVLEALAKAGAIETALDFIRRFWGGMLDYGATTFWEDFSLDWLENSARIDELVPSGKKDLHGDHGDHCYRGFRHSLCHGWASGPTAWLSRHVLGIQPVAAGFSEVRISPHLGSLDWVEGTYPTPHGIISVRHERLPDGRIKSEVQVPKAVKIVTDSSETKSSGN